MVGHRHRGVRHGDVYSRRPAVPDQRAMAGECGCRGAHERAPDYRRSTRRESVAGQNAPQGQGAEAAPVEDYLPMPSKRFACLRQSDCGAVCSESDRVPQHDDLSKLANNACIWSARSMCRRSQRVSCLHAKSRGSIRN
jgi:hypothetical protein